MIFAVGMVNVEPLSMANRRWPRTATAVTLPHYKLSDKHDKGIAEESFVREHWLAEVNCAMVSNELAILLVG